MIFKSFFRKKTTIIYILILIFVTSLFLINYNSYMNVKDEIKENYKNSFIYIKSNYSLDFNDKRITKVLDVFSDGRFYYLINDDLNDNEIIIPDYLKKDGINKDTVEFENSIYEFDIADYYSDSAYLPLKYINSTSMNKIKDSSQYEYYLVLDNWSDKDSIVSYYDNENTYVLSYAINPSNINYISFEKNYKIYSILFLTIDIILLLAIVVSILQNEKKNNNLYETLGFTRKKIMLTNLLKIIMILAISIIISLIVCYIFINFI